MNKNKNVILFKKVKQAKLIISDLNSYGLIVISVITYKSVILLRHIILYVMPYSIL